MLLTGLAPSTKYFYQFGDDVNGWSTERTFVSRPPAGTTSCRFLAYADMGSYAGGTSALSTALRSLEEVVSGYDHGFLLHFGDISALMRPPAWDCVRGLCLGAPPFTH